VRIAYLILAHNNPVHLQRLMKKLRGPESFFYVHIDAKSDIGNFDHLASPTVKFCTRRVACSWGDISLVAATLELMKAAAADERDFDYFALLSGACYPIQSADYIEAFLEKNRGTEFIEVFPLPNVQYGKSLERLTHFWIKKGKPFTRFRWPLQHFLNKHLPLRNYSKALHGGDAVTGSQWWCLSRDAVQYVLDSVAADSRFFRFCKHVDCPDEFFFQAILWNSTFRSKISHSLTFTHWVPKKMSPENIDSSYMSDFKAAIILDSNENNCPNEKREVVFARKFSDTSTAVLDEIDELVSQRNADLITGA